MTIIESLESAKGKLNSALPPGRRLVDAIWSGTKEDQIRVMQCQNLLREHLGVNSLFDFDGDPSELLDLVIANEKAGR